MEICRREFGGKSWNGTSEFISNSTEETIAWGRKFAAQFQPPMLVLLSGELGSGKTTMTKGIVAGLGAAPEAEVTSPTFTLVHVYRNHVRIYHVDLYRVENFHDFETLGLEDLFTEPSVVIVEWSERFALRTDWPLVRISLEHLGGDRRKISVSS